MLVFTVEGVALEQRALASPARYALMIVILCVAAACARWMDRGAREFAGGGLTV